MINGRQYIAKDQDILVAAAAGSGKTAVLVERIIQKIVTEQDPIDVDELLVVTFTNASAAEMRHRIGEALEKAIDEQPTSTHLRATKYIEQCIYFDAALFLSRCYKKILLYDRYRSGF